AVYPAAELVATTLLIPLALASLLSGLALAPLTPWGLFRHWWVALKFVLTSAGVVLALAVLTPALDGAADAAQAGVAVSLADRWVLVRNSGAASIVLVVTLALSVYKPFGRVRRLRLGAGPRSAGAPRVG
ncbi:MAG TPA: hypothetical protein VHF92_17795, partial [Geodermatophilus sp.]|nr:hypothetical protein [Geodermatophilus sp.]